MKKLLLAAAGAFAAVCSSAVAATGTFDGGAFANAPAELGVPSVVFDIGGDRAIGLIGLFDAEDGETVGLDDIQALVQNGATLYNFYVGFAEDAFVGDFSEFEEIGPDGLVTVDGSQLSSGRLFDSLFIEFDLGTNVVFQSMNGGTNTIASQATLEGNPLAPIPVPAAALLFAPVAGGLVAARRRRKAA